MRDSELQTAPNQDIDRDSQRQVETYRDSQRQRQPETARDRHRQRSSLQWADLSLEQRLVVPGHWCFPHAQYFPRVQDSHLPRSLHTNHSSLCSPPSLGVPEQPSGGEERTPKRHVTSSRELRCVAVHSCALSPARTVLRQAAMGCVPMEGIWPAGGQSDGPGQAGGQCRPCGTCMSPGRLHGLTCHVW